MRGDESRPKLFPAGPYIVEFATYPEQKISLSGWRYWSFKLTLVGTDHVFDLYVSESPKAAWVYRQFGVESWDNLPERVLGRKFIVNIEVDTWEGETRNRVREWLSELEA